MCEPDPGVVCLQCGHPLAQHYDEGQPGFCQEMADEPDEDGGHPFCGCGALLPPDPDAARGFTTTDLTEDDDMGMRTLHFDEFPLKEVGHTVLIAGVVFDGPQHQYLVPFPECGGWDRADLAEVDLSVAEWNQLLRQSDTVETEVLQQAADGTITKAMVRKCERVIAGQVSWNVFRRDEFKCRYCGAADRPLTVDHLVLWEEGGPSIEANLVAACKKCNKARGRMQYPDWLRSDYYRRVSQGLEGWVTGANLTAAATLDKISRLVKVRSR